MTTKPYKLQATDLDLSITYEEKDHAELQQGSFGIIGQQRAMTALQMGIDIKAKGYNVFVTGLSGTGRNTAVMKVLKEFKDPDGLKDIAYVYNFANPESPKPLYFKAGSGKKFKQQLHDFIERLKRIIPEKLSTDTFTKQRDKLITDAEHWEARTVSEFEERLASLNFALVQVGEGDEETTDLAPLFNEEVSSFDALQQLVLAGELSEEDWNQKRETYFRLVDEMEQLYSDLRKKQEKLQNEVKNLKVREISDVLKDQIKNITRKFESSRIEKYLSAVSKDIKDHLYLFTEPEQSLDANGLPELQRYGVNVIVDNSGADTPPIERVTHPDFTTLFGTIESVRDPNGENRANFMTIKAGSVLKANGGFLLFRMEDILVQEDAWASMKRSLLDGKTEIRTPQGVLTAPSNVLKPEPVDLDLKVIVSANEGIYDLLFNADEDFQRLFKIHAEFDSTMIRHTKSTAEYLTFVHKVTKDEGMLDVDTDGLEEIIRFGITIAGDSRKLSTRFSLIADLLRESNYWAKQLGQDKISADAVLKALKTRKTLSNMPEEKIDEMIVAGELIMDVEGTSIGKLNGLAVLDRGYYGFGRPVVISATTAPGKHGIVNVEREAGLSGEIHDKGVMILEGFIQSRYAQNFNLSLNASICFEQSYVEVDGDSASSTEIYAVLSSISGLPLRQDLAVTGSVSQRGDIQPVGGVSEKVEGFYEVCKKKGLTGSQGAIIPYLNRHNLLLSKELKNAIKDGTFHIYCIKTIDEGIELLTQTSATEVNAKVLDRLEKMADITRGSLRN